MARARLLIGRTTSAAILIGLMLSGCGDPGLWSRVSQAGAAAAARYGEWDSASVHVVSDSVPRWSESQRWQVDKSPSVDIGVVDGEAPYMLAQAHNPYRLSDGRIVVADMKTTQIRFFDAGGTFIKAVGRAGKGPGEFEQLYRLRKIAGDSLMALEPVSITTIFTKDGKYVRRFMLDRGPPGFSNIWWLGRLDAGYLVAVSLARHGTRPMNNEEKRSSGEEEGVVVPKRPPGYRDSLTHFLYTMDGKLVDSIGDFPGQYLNAEMAFKPDAAYAFDGNRMYYSPAERIEIREFVLDSALAHGGTLPPRMRPMHVARIFHVPAPHSRVVSAADKMHYRETRKAQYKAANRPITDEQLDQSIALHNPFPDSLPAITRNMRVDPDHNIWLQEFNSDDDAPAKWVVIDSTGHWLGVVETPGRFAANEFGRDYVLGIWRDAFDTQHVRLYRLRKPNVIPRPPTH